MTDIPGIKVSIKLSVKLGSTGPGQKGAIQFAYEPGAGAVTLGAKVDGNGEIDLRGVKSDARLQFEIVEPLWPNPILTWGSKRYAVSIRSNKTDSPERDTLRIAKGPKPQDSSKLDPYPVAGKEFDAFYYSGNDNRSIHVYTKNSDRTSEYWYALSVQLTEIGVASPAPVFTCWDDPQIKNGGNRPNNPLWWFAAAIIAANAIVTYLVLFARHSTLF